MTIESKADGDGEEHLHWRKNVWVLTLGSFCTACGFTTPFPYLPLILRELGVIGPLESWTGFAVGGFFGITFLTTPLWGALADHYGRKSMVLRAGWGMGIGFTALALAPGLNWFLPLYVITGAFAGYMPTRQTA